MRSTWRQLGALLLAGALYAAALSGCASGGQTDAADNSGIENTEQAQTFRGSDLGVKSDMELSFPFLGLAVEIPESLGQRMDSGEVMCQADESISNGMIDYAFLWWSVIPEENRDTEFDINTYDSEALNEWFAALERVGTIGVFHRNVGSRISQLTGCDTHTILGTNGEYQYVLSLREGADETAAEELRQTAKNITITEMTPFSGESAFEAPRAEISSLGEFTTENIAGETVTQNIFKDHKLTLVNLFTTWCSPCVQEIPELEELSRAMADKGVQVIGVVLDAVDENGNRDGEAIEKAKVLQERTGASYLFLIPDETNWNGRLTGITSVPETFFVDENGSIVGSTYVGSRDLASWTEIVETELAALEGAA